MEFSVMDDVMEMLERWGWILGDLFGFMMKQWW